ncbi:MAG: hypothetical protein HQK83_04885 [Fibrobacteria bacterium]|nr:hypothetical protein [Fibrobacteria bacterium]
MTNTGSIPSLRVVPLPNGVMLPMYVIARRDRAIQRTKVSKIDESHHFFWWIPRSSRGMTSLNHFFILMTQPVR